VSFAIAGGKTWIASGSELVAIERGSVVARSSTGLFGGSASFAARSGGAFGLRGEWIQDLERDLRIGRILEGGTWFRVGEELGFGFYRAGLATFYFLFDPDRPGLVDVKLPPIDGHLVDASAVFDASHVLFSCVFEKQGRSIARMFLIHRSGAVLGRLEGSPDGHRLLASTRGRCVRDGRMLLVTDDGLLSLALDRATGLIVEGTLFEDTEPFVASGMDLLPGPNGSVYVVGTNEITELVLA
jgi:hypothetical protein